jgi:hypothetical protein
MLLDRNVCIALRLKILSAMVPARILVGTPAVMADFIRSFSRSFYAHINVVGILDSPVGLVTRLGASYSRNRSLIPERSKRCIFCNMSIPVCCIQPAVYCYRESLSSGTAAGV